MIKKLNLKFFISLSAIILASIYLTFIIDAYTLNTWLKRIFVFCYFVIASFSLFKCFSRLKLTNHNVISAIALLLTIISLIFLQSAFLPAKNEHSFYLHSTLQDEEAEYTELAITDIKIDGETQVISKINTEVIGNWAYESANDNFILTPSESIENLICFTVVGENITFSFKTENPKRQVEIYDDYGYREILVLTDEGGSTVTTEHTINFGKTYSIAERIIYNVGVLIIMMFTYKIIIELLRIVISKYSKKKTDIIK